MYVITFPGTLASELGVAVHRLLPVPTIYHSHTKSHEIFSSFISTYTS